MEGVLLCQLLNLQLHSLEISDFGENNIFAVDYLVDAEKGFLVITDEDAEKLYTDPKILHIANFSGKLHYVPLVPKSQNNLYDKLENIENNIISHTLELLQKEDNNWIDELIDEIIVRPSPDNIKTLFEILQNNPSYTTLNLSKMHYDTSITETLQKELLANVTLTEITLPLPYKKGCESFLQKNKPKLSVYFWAPYMPNDAFLFKEEQNNINNNCTNSNLNKQAKPNTNNGPK